MMSPAPSSPLTALSTLALTAVIGLASSAHAQDRDPLAARDRTDNIAAPGTHGMFATLSLAPAFGLSSNAATQFKLGQTFGYHFSGDASGFAVGAEIQESFAGGAFALNIGPKAWYDFAVARDYGVYIAPTLMMGLGYVSVDGYSYFGGSTSAAGFDMQFGVEVKVILADRGLIFIRPMTIDIGIGSSAVVRYDLVFGGGATF